MLSPPSISPGIDGVYFQKISKSTGVESLVQLIPSSEIPANTRFGISQVVTDGTNFYFHACNNSVYCVRPDGTIKWKDDGLVPGNVTDNGELAGSFVYLFDGRLYVVFHEVSTDATLLIGLNAETGTFEYSFGAPHFPPTAKEFIFGNKFLAEFSGTGSPQVNLFSYDDDITLGTHFNLGIPVGAWDDSDFIYLLNGQVRVMKANFPGHVWNLDGEFITDYDFIYENKILYGAAIIEGYFSFIMTSYDPNPSSGHVLWSKSFSPPGNMSDRPVIYNYFLRNDRLYFFTNFHIENNQVIVDNNTAAAIIVDAANGNIL